jgi:hypothetical protein
MNLQEIRTLRGTCRAKVEDLLGRTASREMSTAETQMRYQRPHDEDCCYPGEAKPLAPGVSRLTRSWTACLL